MFIFIIYIYIYHGWTLENIPYYYKLINVMINYELCLFEINMHYRQLKYYKIGAQVNFFLDILSILLYRKQWWNSFLALRFTSKVESKHVAPKIENIL